MSLKDLFPSGSVVDKAGESVDLDSLSEKTIGLYFSAHWCPPCRKFTPVLADKYNELSAQIEIIFISGDEDEEAAASYFATHPWKMLKFSETETNEKLNALFDVKGIPTLVLLDGSNGELITTDGRSALFQEGGFSLAKLRAFETEKREAEEKKAALLRALKDDFSWAKAFEGTSLVGKTDSAPLTTTAALSGKKIVALYFSAHWCPPCQRFTPLLAEKYNAYKAEGKDLEIVFVSFDRDEASWSEYYSHMPWLALDYKTGRETAQLLGELFEIEGIPSLLTFDGATAKLLSNDAEDFMTMPFDDLADCAAKKAEAEAAATAAVEALVATMADKLMDARHEHSLDKMPSVYKGGKYGCDVCGKGGHGWVYHCNECGWDAHPHCVVVAAGETVLTAVEAAAGAEA